MNTGALYAIDATQYPELVPVAEGRGPLTRAALHTRKIFLMGNGLEGAEEENGRPDWTRTNDLFRVKEAL